MGAFIAVLILGTIYGVVIGVILSFGAMVFKSAVPPRSFLGIIPGREGFYDLNRNRDATEIANTVIYRFNGSLFFGNINVFQNDIENSIKESTKVVIVDAGGISSIDFTAAERLEMLYENLKDRGIHFYITEHIGELNDEIRKLGLANLIREGVIRRTISMALNEEGMIYPYPLEHIEGKESMPARPSRIREEVLEEFEWAFGKDAEHQMELHAQEVIENITKLKANFTPETDINLKAKAWRHLSNYDQDKLFEHLERHLNEVAAKLGQPVDAVEANILEHRIKLWCKMKNENKEFYDRYMKKREKYEKLLKNENPELYNSILQHRREQMKILKENKPQVFEEVKKWIEEDIAGKN